MRWSRIRRTFPQCSMAVDSAVRGDRRGGENQFMFGGWHEGGALCGRRSLASAASVVIAEELEPRRLLSIADPDPTFGTGGSVTLPFVPDIVRLQPNGELLAAQAVQGTYDQNGAANAHVR